MDSRAGSSPRVKGACSRGLSKLTELGLASQGDSSCVDAMRPGSPPWLWLLAVAAAGGARGSSHALLWLPPLAAAAAGAGVPHGAISVSPLCATSAPAATSARPSCTSARPSSTSARPSCQATMHLVSLDFSHSSCRCRRERAYESSGRWAPHQEHEQGPGPTRVACRAPGGTCTEPPGGSCMASRHSLSQHRRTSVRLQPKRPTTLMATFSSRRRDAGGRDSANEPCEPHHV